MQFTSLNCAGRTRVTERRWKGAIEQLCGAWSARKTERCWFAAIEQRSGAWFAWETERCWSAAIEQPCRARVARKTDRLWTWPLKNCCRARVAWIADWHWAASAVGQAWRGTAGKQHKRSDQRQHHISFHKLSFAPSVGLVFLGNSACRNGGRFQEKRIVGFRAGNAGRQIRRVFKKQV